MKAETSEQKRLLLTEANIEKAYPKAEFMLGLSTLLIGFYWLLQFILPAIEEQNEERERDINIALITLSLAVVSSIVMQVLEKVPAIKRKQRDNMSILFAHFRSASLNVGIILGFLQQMAALLAESYGEHAFWLQDVSKWFAGKNSAERAGIALSLVTTATILDFFLTKAELFRTFTYVQLDDEGNAINDPLLKTFNMHKRDWNIFSRIRWFCSIFGGFVNNYMFSLLPILFAESFDIVLDKNSKRAIPFIIGGLAVLFNLVPDHPFVSKYPQIQPLKKLSRFMNNFFTLALRNTCFYSQLHMNVISLMHDKPEINISNSAAATTMLAYLYLAIYLSEVRYRIVSVLNDSTPTVAPFLKAWNFAEKLSKSIVAGANLFPSNLYILIPISALAVADFITEFVDRKNLSRWKKLLASLPENLNQGLFNAGLFLQLTKLGQLDWPLKTTAIIPAALIFMLASAAEKYNPAISKILSPVNAGLLGSGLYIVLQQSAALFDKNIPGYWRYIFFASSLILKGTYNIYDYVASHKRMPDDEKSLLKSELIIEDNATQLQTVRNYKTINQQPAAKNSLFFKSADVINKIAKLTTPVLILLIGFAMFNKMMQAFDSGSTSSTENTAKGMMMGVIASCALLMFYTLYDNLSDKSAFEQTDILEYSNPSSPVITTKIQ